MIVFNLSNSGKKVEFEESKEFKKDYGDFVYSVYKGTSPSIVINECHAEIYH
jgi:hypothetical protein